MIEIDKVKVNGFKDAARGMRNSFNSWAKGDSDYVDGDGLGIRDVELMKKLSRGGSSHAKFRRFITVTCDILAPLYWWKEFDTYKVGTVANSCSTMHTITEKEFEWADFSFEHLGVLIQNNYDYGVGTGIYQFQWHDAAKSLLNSLNQARDMYLEEKDPDLKKQYWWQIIQLLPTSYNQKRTVLLNYEVLSAMYLDRKNHKLDEWRTFCEWIEKDLPYAKGIIFADI